MRLVLLCPLGLCYGLTARAQELSTPPDPISAEATVTGTRLVALDLRAEAGLEAGAARLLNEVLLTELGEARQYEVLGGADLRALLELEQYRQLLGCHTDACLSDLGRALEAGYLVAASAGKVGRDYVINVKLIDVRLQRVVRRSSEQVRGDQAQLIAAVRRSVQAVTSTGRDGLSGAAVTEAPDPTPSLLVLETRVNANVAQQIDKIALTNLTSALVTQHGSYKVMSQQEVVAMLDAEQQRQLLGCDEVSCVADVGAALGARYLLYSHVGQVGERLVTSVSLIDATQAVTVDRQSVVVDRPARVVDAMSVVTLRLLGQEATLPPEARFNYALLEWTGLGLSVAAGLVGASGTALALVAREEALGTADQGTFNAAVGRGEAMNALALSGYAVAGVLALLSGTVLLFDLLDPTPAGEAAPRPEEAS